MEMPISAFDHVFAIQSLYYAVESIPGFDDNIRRANIFINLLKSLKVGGKLFLDNYSAFLMSLHFNFTTEELFNKDPDRWLESTTGGSKEMINFELPELDNFKFTMIRLDSFVPMVELEGIDEKPSRRILHGRGLFNSPHIFVLERVVSIE